MKHQIASTHLDQTISFLHSPEEQRASLALDLTEAFEPHVVDGLIFQIVLRDELDDAWFQQDDGVCRLSELGRRQTLEKWVTRTKRIEDEYSFKDLFRRQALSIERHVLRESENSNHLSGRCSMYALICYDVPVGRTERFRKILSRFLIHETENSAFAGEITEAELCKIAQDT